MTASDSREQEIWRNEETMMDDAVMRELTELVRRQEAAIDRILRAIDQDPGAEEVETGLLSLRASTEALEAGVDQVSAREEVRGDA